MPHCPGEDESDLVDIGHVAAQHRLRHLREIDIADPNLPAGGQGEAPEELRQILLSAAAGPDDRHVLLAADFEADPFDRLDEAVLGE